jgi:hypothetical protein
MLAPHMRRLLWLILLAAVVPRALAAQPAGTTAGALRRDITAVEDLYPRLEGSAGEKALLALVAARLQSLGLRGEPFDFRDSDTAHSFSSCLRVDVAGARGDTVILAVPLNHPSDAPPGADGSVSVALALDLLARLAGSRPPVSFTVLFLGAEHGDSGAYPMGSSLFLRDFRPSYPVAVLSLNLHAVPSRLLVRGAGRGVASPSWLLTRCMRSLAAAGIPAAASRIEAQALRLGLADGKTLIEPYLAAGFPAVQLDGEYAAPSGSTGGDASDGAVLDRFPRFAEEFLAASAQGIPADWDRHFLIFRAGSYPVVIGERTSVAVIVCTLLAMLLYSLVFRRGMRKYVRSLSRNALRVIPILVLTFLFLLAGTGAVRAVLALRGFPRLWEYAPLEFLGLKVAVPLLLYAGLYVVLRRLPFPRAGSFYTAAAMFFLLVDIVVVTALDISFTWYFLLAFLFVFFSALVPNRVGKLLVLLPAPAALVRGLVDLFLLPALPFCRVVLLSPLWGNLLAAGIMLPFILALLRIGLLFPGTGVLRRGLREPLLAVALTAAVGLLAVRLLTFSPFSAERPRPVRVVQSIDERAGTNTLEISSPAPLGELSLADPSGSRTLRTAGTTLQASLPAAGPLVRVEVRSSEFLGKTNLALLVEAGGSPRSASAVLTAPQDFILFDCSLPFVRESAREYRLLIGAFPPDPLPLELTFPAGGAFTLTLTMDFDAPLLGAEVSVPGAAVRTRVHLVQSIPLRS